MSNTLRFGPFSAALAVAILANGAARAQDAAPAEQSAADSREGGFDEIVVTAQRREENLQSVPVAVSVVTGERLQSQGTFDPSDLGRVTTGLVATPFNGDRTNVFYTLRGLSYSTGTLFPAVQPYFAEVPLGKLLVGTFFDLENLQTLRGPQGTLFGRVTDGGNILLQPRKPTGDFGGSIQVKIGDYALRQANGAINIPIAGEKLAVRAAFEVAKRRGFTYNVAQDTHLDGVDYQSVRFSVIARPFDGFENYTVVNYTHGDDSGGSSIIYFINPTAVLASTTAVYGAAGAASYLSRLQAALARQLAAGSKRTWNDTIAFDRRKQLILTNSSTLDLTDKIKAKAILGYIYLRQQTGNDYDGTDISYLNTDNAFLPTPLNYQRQISGEFQLQGKAFSDILDFTLGFYADRQNTPGKAESSITTLSFLRRYTPQYYKTTSTAFYGQVGADLGSLIPGLKAVGGIRRTTDTSYTRLAIYSTLIGADASLVPHGQCLILPTPRPAPLLASSVSCREFNAKFKITTWNTGLEWKVSDDLFLYGRISKGYRPGGFNTSVVQPSYTPETNVSKELGLKLDQRVADIPMRWNVAVFFDKWRNTQRLVTFSEPGIGTSSATVNVPSAHVNGLESEFSAKPWAGATLGVNWTHFLKARYDTKGYTAAFIAAGCPANAYITVADASKFCPFNGVPRVPKDTLNLSFRQSLDVGDGELSFGGDWFFTRHQFYSSNPFINPETREPGYNVGNFNASYAFGSLPIEIGAFVTNVTDKVYGIQRSNVSQLGSLGFAGRSFGAPRMYGASLKYSFGE